MTRGGGPCSPRTAVPASATPSNPSATRLASVGRMYGSLTAESRARKRRARHRRPAGRRAAIAAPDGLAAEQPAREPRPETPPPVQLHAQRAGRNARQLELEAAA